MIALRSRPDIQLQSLDDARQYSIAVSNGSYGEDYMRKNGFGGRQLVAVTHPAQLIKMLYAGRVDLVADEFVGFNHRGLKLGISQGAFKKVYQLEPKPTALYFAFSLQTSEVLVGRFRAAYQQLKVRGLIDRIYDNYEYYPDIN